MEGSILKTIKKMLGGAAENSNFFDSEIIALINSALSTLSQLGVQSNDLVIFGADEIWEDITDNDMLLGFIKEYVFLSVKLTFDTPLSSAVIDSMSNQISKLEWRILVAQESINKESDGEIQNE